MAAKFLLATAVVSGADAATRITAQEADPTARVVARMATIQAAAANTTDVYVGDSTVKSSTAKGVALAAKESLSLAGVNNEIQLQEIYFASQATSQKVNVFYVEG